MASQHDFSISAEIESRRLNGGGTSLFGSLSSLEPDIFMYSLMLVIVAVFCVEYFFHSLHTATHETPFNKLIQAVEKELMVVGFTAFCFKVIINAGSFIDERWLFSLEFSDLIIPIFAFSNCFLGIILIILSLKQCDLWSRAFHLKLEEVLDEFFDYATSWRAKLIYNPFRKSVSQVEFRIFHSIFCELFRIQRDAFAFDEYIQSIYEKFVLSIIEIRLVNWVIFIGLMLFSLMRNNKGGIIYKCDHGHSQCSDEGSTVTFTIFGFGLYVVTWIFLIVSRYYEHKIIVKRGLSSIHDYPTYLEYMEELSHRPVEKKRLNEEQLKSAVGEAKRIRKHHHHRFAHMHPQYHGPSMFSLFHEVYDFFHQVHLYFKKEEELHREEHLNQKSMTDTQLSKFTKDLQIDVSTKSKESGNSNFVSSSNVSAKYTDSSVGSPGRQGSQSPSEGNAPPQAQHVEEQEHPNLAMLEEGLLSNEGTQASDSNKLEGRDGPVAQSEAGTGSLLLSLPKKKATLPPLDSKNKKSVTIQEPTDQPEGTAQPEQSAAADSSEPEPSSPEDKGEFHLNYDKELTSTSIKNFESAAPKTGLPVSPSKDRFATVNHKPDFIKSIFLFGRPHIYFEGVYLLIMFISLYISLWIVNFSNVNVGHGFKFLAILPGILSFLNYILIVRSAALLKAIYRVDKDSMLEVLEQTEGSRQLAATIRDKLISKLDLMGDAGAELKRLFEEIDDDHNNNLSRMEFEILMDKLDISFSRKKWKHIYREIDRNFDDKISFEEFFIFLFPNHDTAMAFEQKRLNAVKNRVALKSMKHGKLMKSMRSKKHKKNNSQTIVPDGHDDL